MLQASPSSLATCAGEKLVDYTPMTRFPSSCHVRPTAPVAERPFWHLTDLPSLLHREFPPVSRPIQRFKTLLSHLLILVPLYNTRPPLVVALRDGVPFYPDRSCVTKTDNERAIYTPLKY
jgi:hypothetical protein